jgi:hypothetical protein
MRRCGAIRLWSVIAALVGASVAARADVASDKAAAILVFPKLLIDTSNAPPGPRGQIDTLIRVSNTSRQPISMHCFYVDSTPQCPSVAALRDCIANPLDCVANGCTWQCQQKPLQIQEIDFYVSITALQPIAWLVSQGSKECSPTTPEDVPCFPLTRNNPRPDGESNQGSLIPPVQKDPFVGELKCIAVDANGMPVERNDLKGEVEITRVKDNVADVEGYNAIGIPAILPYCSGDATIPCTKDSDCQPPTTPSDEGTCVQPPNNGNDTLVLGGNVCKAGTNAGNVCSSAADCPSGSCVNAGEYVGCPNVLILDHFFDGANDPVTSQEVTTDLTLVPCSEDFLTQAPVATVVQFQVFNEFEERFSTSRTVTCFAEWPIWTIGGSQSMQRSIFSAAVAGTLTGQTRIRGVAVEDPTFGHTLLGVAEEFREGGGSAATNLHFSGSRPQSDYLYYSP